MTNLGTTKTQLNQEMLFDLGVQVGGTQLKMLVSLEGLSILE